MKVVRWCTALAVTLVSSRIADAQLPGLPYSPWQSGMGYFVGPNGTGATLHHLRGGCGVHYDFRYGFLWTSFLSPVSPNNATPTGYSGLVTACQGIYQPLPPPPPPQPPPPPGPPVVTPPVLEPHVTPEPATWVLLGTGMVAILGFAALKSTRI